MSLERITKCVVEEDKKKFSINDPGTGRRATISVGARKCQKIQVDGQLLEIVPCRCDWCIRDKGNADCLFVELKGNDCKHAAEQICNTIRWFSSKVVPFQLASCAYIVANSGIPRLNSTIQNAIAKIGQKYKIKLVFTHSPAQLKFP